MVKKTTAQLKREIKKLKGEDRKKRVKINKSMKEIEEKKELEKELKELKRSPAYKKIRSFSKKKLTKEQLEKRGKEATKAAKTLWRTAGKIVHKLDKISI